MPSLPASPVRRALISATPPPVRTVRHNEHMLREAKPRAAPLTARKAIPTRPPSSRSATM
ncbi:hypothetical protein GCM10020220_071460 [Nonomuraea rubra]